MIEIKLIPDGLTKVPAEATDHGILWSKIQNNSTEVERQAFVASTATDVNGIQDIERVVPGSEKHIKLRLPGRLTDYTDNLLDATAAFITDDTKGLKAHPNGWVEVDQPR